MLRSLVGSEMCIRDSPPMADVSVMEKQLVAKSRQIAELQNKLTDKMRRLHDFESELERKDRNIYFLERDMDSRSRSLGKLRLRSNNLEALASKHSYAPEIDGQESAIAQESEKADGMRAEFEEAKKQRDHTRSLSEAYQNVHANLPANANAEKIVELLQGELNRVEQQHGTDKQQLLDLKQAMVETEDQFVKMRGQVRFLESYRVDAIFRVFSLKGQARILQQDIDDKVNLRRDELGIKQRYSHLGSMARNTV
eukprot:TRINITY_DN29396_c0_g1_i2.p1 TRINITY_DN29396_c0_g1~~TRINITY_DN29396_c0_g1_i2.p1  ORF type:complete len:254 (+),score=91.28 TRINITY_DN29396_c0_g1_i2:110-871(+)